MAVRRALLHDVPDIARVQTASWEAVYRGLIPESIFERMTVERRTESLSNYMANRPPRAVLLAAEAMGDIVGMAWIGPCRDDDMDGALVGELLAVYVDPQHWDGGHGKALMLGALDEMRSLGFEEASLWVLDTNERGRRFYEHGGWLADGAVKIDGSYGDPLREVRYRLEL